MAILSKQGKIMQGNLIYIPKHVQRNIGASVGTEVQWKWEDGRLYLEAVKK